MAHGRLPGTSSRRFRLCTRSLALLVSIVLAWPLVPGKWTSVLVPGISPYVAVGSALAGRSVGVVVFLGLPVLLVSVFSRRWFCRYACPVGLLCDATARLRRSTLLGHRRVGPIGQWVALLTLGGALLGYPLLLWLDPLAIFSLFFGTWHRPLGIASLVAGLTLPAVLLAGLLIPNLWCLRLCPLGAMQDLLALPGQWMRRQSLSMQPPGLARRSFLLTTLGAIGALAGRRAAASGPQPIRPPGAVDARRFTGLCIRCGNCARACPSHILQADIGSAGVMGLLAPVARFDNDYCREDCHRCNLVCPSGAIARLTLAQKRCCVMGVAQVDLDNCRLANGAECTVCIQQCPYQAIEVATAADGFGTLPRVDAHRCTGCGACEALCPVRPVRAVRVVAQGLTG